MKRRTFLLSGGVLPAATLLEASRGNRTPDPAPHGREPLAGEERLRLAGLTLPELGARYRF